MATELWRAKYETSYITDSMWEGPMGKTQERFDEWMDKRTNCQTHAVTCGRWMDDSLGAQADE